MSTHQFTLIVDGPDLQDDIHVNALFEAGCDDATAGRVGAIQYLDLAREAETFGDPSNSRFITTFNAGLSWRQVEDQLPEAERQGIRQLVG